YVLIYSKHQDAYWNAVIYIVIQTGCLLEPASVTCDFEKGLMKAMTEQFLSLRSLGVFFHLEASSLAQDAERAHPAGPDCFCTYPECDCCTHNHSGKRNRGQGMISF
ncbi:hypothetical protein L917_14240, partial [Phytophthora nicotianae]